MSNMQNNFYGIPWQQSSQQVNYGQVPNPYMNQPPMNYDRYSAPPPPPPPDSQQQQQPPMEAPNQHQSMRKQNNFNQGFNNSNNSNRGQHNNFNNRQQQQNFRGNRGRGGGNNARGGHSRFNPDSNNSMQNFNQSNMNSNMGNYNEQNQMQMQSNFGNNRGKNSNNRNMNKGNWMKNNANHVPPSSSTTITTSAPPVHFSQEVSQQPNFSFNTSAVSGTDSFESEFRKWEEQFERWLNEMKDHPDQHQYQTYKKQFLEYREMLSNRLKKLKEKSVTTPTMTEEQIKFKNEWSAGDPSNKDSGNFKDLPSTSKNMYEATTSAVQVAPTSFSLNSDIPASSILFGNSMTEPPPKSFTVDDDDFASFEHSSAEPSYSNFAKSQSAIPGLDFSMPPEVHQEKEQHADTVILDEDEPITNNLPPPPVPTFCLKKSRCMVKINDILEEPGRSNRFQRILVMIRGAPGSGKHHLARLIEKRELEMGNDRCRILSIRKFFSNNYYDSKRINDYDERQFCEFKDTVLEGYITFIIVVLNGCGIKQFNRIAHYSYNKFDCFSIEVHQKTEICQKYDINRRSIVDIRNANDDLVRFSTPTKFKQLDPTSLYYPNGIPENRQSNTDYSQPEQQAFNNSVPPPRQNMPERPQRDENIAFRHAVPKPDVPEPSNKAATSSSAAPSNNDDFAKKVTEILKDENVLNLLQAHMNKAQPPPPQQQQQQPPPHQHPRQNNYHNQNRQNQMPFRGYQNNNLQQQQQQQRNAPSFDDCPIFKPSKVVDYNHLHKQTLEETLMEFKVFRVMEYNHASSYKLNDFLRDIDVDKIIEKRKAVALRKKILEYLRSAERPEDTVSNPKYPKNWEVIKQERPPRKSKRRKLLTTKIKRVLLQKSREETSWMTKGYVRDENQPLELETISSESDDDMDEQPAKKQKIEVSLKPEKSKVPEFVDEYRDVYKTIPDFNHFNHQKYVNIQHVLYPSQRRNRPSKIVIIMRGAPGSGKSHLAQLIKRKESQIGNSDMRILSIDDYFLTEEDDEEEAGDQKTRMVLKERYIGQIQRHLKKTISDNLYNLIIIDAENCDLNTYNQFYQLSYTSGFSVFTIELYQKPEICIKQCKHSSSIEDIPKAVELLENFRISSDHTLMIPTALYEEFDCFVNPELEEKKPKGSEETADSIKNYQNYLVQTIDDDNFLSLMPQFNWHNREITDIREILEEPNRSKRNKSIAILMRGPGGGSGKNELASAILAKEREHGNEKATFLSIEEFFINQTTNKYEFNSRNVDANVQKLIRKLMELIKAKTYNFLIVDVETGDFSHYTQVYELLSKQSQCYTIETYQEAILCAENDVYKRSQKEFESILEEIHLNPTPDEHILLDASMFYKHQPSESLDKPLKSALKISPNSSFSAIAPDSNELEKIHERLSARMSLHERFESSFNQRVFVNGKFVERNSSPPSNLPEFNWFNEDIVDIRDILEEPNRFNRPEKIVIFIRGAPASGKTYLAGLITRKELEKGNNENTVLLSIDEYFEAVKYRETESGKYEQYIESSADHTEIDSYMQQLDEDFSNVLESGESTFIVLDGDFCDLKYYNEMWNKAVSFGFTCYVIELNQDDNTCIKYNDHKWNESHILERNKTMQNIQSPKEHTLLDPEYLYHEYKYEFNPEGDVFTDSSQVDISEENEAVEEVNEDESNELSFGKFKMSAQKSKWEDDDTPDIERLDGIVKNKSTKRVTMADYLQTDDAEEWSMRPSTSGKKRVRWADIEEKKAQEKMRKIGFIVGHTDWNRMTDESDGKSALEKTKFIEPRKKK